MEASIIIRARNEARYVDLVLERVFSQRRDGDFEVLLLDSGSTDATLKIAGRYPVRLQTIRPQDFSFGYALNLGARLARGKYVIHLSAHCLPTGPEWLKNLLSPLRQNRELAAVFGRQLPFPGANPYEEFEMRMLFREENHNLFNRQVFSNSNCAIRREVVLAHPFAEDISFAEDFLWLRKLPVQHQVLYAPEAAVYHSHTLRPNYWYGRFKADAESRTLLHFREHLPWQSPNGHSGRKSLPRRYLGKLRRLGAFLWSERYYLHFSLLPAHELLRMTALGHGIFKGCLRLAKNHRPPDSLG